MSSIETRSTSLPNRGRPESERTGFKEIRQDLEKTAHDISTMAGEAAQSGIEAMKQGKDKALATGRKAGDAAKEAHERVCDYIVAHPTASVLIAAGIGAVLGRLFLMRR